MTVRNIRAYRSRGLLPPPRRVGRRGFYGSDHIRRLEQIHRLQNSGFNLAAIGALIGDGALDPLPGEVGLRAAALRRHALSPWLDEDPAVLTADELNDRFGGGRSQRAEACRLGLLELIGPDRYLVPSPTIIAVSEELVSLGIASTELLRLQRTLFDHTQEIAAGFVDLCLSHAWRPYAEEGYPRERWEQVRRSADRLQPLLTRLMLAAFGLHMRRAARAILDADEPASASGE